MGYTRISSPASEEQQPEVRQPGLRLPLHISLFVLTFISMIMAGAFWIGKNPLEISNWVYGLTYAVLLMVFLSAHEFGHYIAARIHKVDATLPFYIPFPFLFLNPFGTMGAVIRTRSPIPSRRALFDIGVAGPIAGFVVCLIILVVGFITLPGKEYLYTIHPEYMSTGGKIPIWGMHFGDNLIFSALASFLSNPKSFLPPMNEIYHYPFLCVGWFGLFVTSLNLLPIGQLDGGHITYAMFGHKHRVISRIVWWTLVVLGTGSFLGVFHDLLKPDHPDKLFTFFQSMFLPVLNGLRSIVPWLFNGWFGWLVWALITRTLIKLDHPPVPDSRPLDTRRMAIGWVAILIFVGSVSYNGIYFIDGPSQPPTPSDTIVQQAEMSMILPE